MVGSSLTVSGGIIAREHIGEERIRWEFLACDVAIDQGIVIELSRSAICHGDHHIDARGCVVLPAFANCHTHGFEFAFKGFKDNRRIDDVHPEWFWRIYKNAPLELMELGFKVHLAEAAMSGIAYVGEVLRRDVHGGNFVRALADAGLKGRVFGIAGGCTGYDLGSEVEEDFGERLEHARRLPASTVIHLHCLESEDRRQAVIDRFGVPTPQLLADFGLVDRPLVLTHCGAARREDLKPLADHRNALIVSTPGAECALQEHSIDMGTINELGLTIGLGTDGPCYDPLTDLFHEMRIALSRARTVNATKGIAELLYASTVGPRPWLGGSSVGICLGAAADLQIVSMQRLGLRPVVRKPYDNIEALIVRGAIGSDVRATIVDGNILYLDGKLTTPYVAPHVERLESALADYYHDLGFR